MRVDARGKHRRCRAGSTVEHAHAHGSSVSKRGHCVLWGMVSGVAWGCCVVCGCDCRLCCACWACSA